MRILARSEAILPVLQATTVRIVRFLARSEAILPVLQATTVRIVRILARSGPLLLRGDRLLATSRGSLPIEVPPDP